MVLEVKFLNRLLKAACDFTRIGKEEEKGRRKGKALIIIDQPCDKHYAKFFLFACLFVCFLFLGQHL